MKEIKDGLRSERQRKRYVYLYIERERESCVVGYQYAE